MRRDSLTGLLNRAAAKEHIEIEIERCIATRSTGALMMLYLDNFKLINDTLGHDAGDAVLKAVAVGLGDQAGAKAARLGGDEFAVVLSDAPDHDVVRETAEAILDRLRQPIAFHGRVLSPRASIGVALFLKHGRTPAELLKNADIALYAAKAFGRGGFVTFVPSMGGQIRRRAAAVDMVRPALAYDHVEAVYEPMVELRTGKLFGFQAKLKVHRPDCLSRRGAPMEYLAHSASFQLAVNSAPSKPGIKHCKAERHGHSIAAASAPGCFYVRGVHLHDQSHRFPRMFRGAVTPKLKEVGRCSDVRSRMACRLRPSSRAVSSPASAGTINAFRRP